MYRLHISGTLPHNPFLFLLHFGIRRNNSSLTKMIKYLSSPTLSGATACWLLECYLITILNYVSASNGHFTIFYFIVIILFPFFFTKSEFESNGEYWMVNWRIQFNCKEYSQNILLIMMYAVCKIHIQNKVQYQIKRESWICKKQLGKGTGKKLWDFKYGAMGIKL